MTLCAPAGPDGKQTLERGDLGVGFPAGPAGAHKVMNRSDARARTLLFSLLGGTVTRSDVYPDSDTVGVWAGDQDQLRVFVRGTAVPWAHGEEGWNKAD